MVTGHFLYADIGEVERHPKKSSSEWRLLPVLELRIMLTRRVHDVAEEITIGKTGAMAIAAAPPRIHWISSTLPSRIGA